MSKYDLLVTMDLLNYRAALASGKNNEAVESTTLIEKLKERKGIK